MVRPVNGIRPVSQVAPIYIIESTEPVSFESMKLDLLALQSKVYKYNNWEYFQKMMELQENIRCHQEILEKYPYDGKSTFAELLEQEWKKLKD